MSNAEDYIQNSETNPEVEDIDYTIILPGGLVNKPVTGRIKIILFLLQAHHIFCSCRTLNHFSSQIICSI